MGVDLLNLPEEILQNVARYFTLAEWIQGPAQACCLLYWLKLTRVDLNCHRVEERGSSYRTLTTASKQISCALACADRHIGPSTTSISVSTEAIQDSLINFIGRSQASLSPSMLPNVISLELVLSDRDQPLALAFDNPCSAGEALNTFCVVASEVSIDAAALLAMTDALIRRGLTLSMAQAGPEHEHAPSQCLYIHAVSAPQLSYDEAVQFVSKRVGMPLTALYHRMLCLQLRR
ncbi:g11205 [Coccomyxa viridis]|uniref:G11205 protein n=1 Tax=Coccomyxa viridis TaxID=1274662 RepID=A0ABP1GD59_9CHLO